MEYIRSSLAAPPVAAHDAFFQQMAARQWRAAIPFVRRDGLARHLEKGLLPIGARRDLGPHPMVEDKSAGKGDDNAARRLPGGPNSWEMGVPGRQAEAKRLEGFCRSARAVSHSVLGGP